MARRMSGAGNREDGAGPPAAAALCRIRRGRPAGGHFVGDLLVAGSRRGLLAHQPPEETHSGQVDEPTPGSPGANHNPRAFSRHARPLPLA